MFKGKRVMEFVAITRFKEKYFNEIIQMRFAASCLCCYSYKHIKEG
jgi:hypothetical protein